MEKWGKLSSINRKSLDTDFELSNNKIEIGRGENCGIRIDNPKISKVHCILLKEDDGNIYLEDKSSNGTYLFDTLVGKDNKKQINSGDIIYLLHKDKVKGKCEDLGLVFSPILIVQPVQPQSQPQSQPKPAEDTTNADNIVEESKIDEEKEKEMEKIKAQLKNEREKKKQMAEQLGEDFKCGICCEYIYDCATVSPCLHNFCAGCLSELLQTSDTCPLCRDPISQVKKNSQINGIIDRFIHKQPDLKRMQEEYEELDLKNVITSQSLPLNFLKTLIKQKYQERKFKQSLEEIRERLQKRMNREIDSDYSYVSEDEDNAINEEKILPGECVECKIARVDDGFKCGAQQVHLNCNSCGTKFPERQEQTNQRCILCKDAYCALYLGVCRGDLSSQNKKNPKFLKQFKDYQAPQQIAQQIFRNNLVEYDIFQDYLRKNKIKNDNVMEYVIDKWMSQGQFYFEKSKALLANYNQPTVRTCIELTTPLCHDCFHVVWHQIVFKYRVDIKDKLHPSVSQRPICHWGINCSTQLSKQQHADRFDHVCEQTRF